MAAVVLTTMPGGVEKSDEAASWQVNRTLGEFPNFSYYSTRLAIQTLPSNKALATARFLAFPTVRTAKLRLGVFLPSACCGRG